MKSNISKLIVVVSLLLVSCTQTQSILTSIEEPEKPIIQKYINIVDISLSKVYLDEISISVKIDTNENNLVTKCSIINGNEILNEFTSDSMNPSFEIPITKEMRQIQNNRANICIVSPSGNRKETDVELNNINQIENIWPIKVKFAPTVHDFHLNSEGPEKVAGFTHNNGLRREKHYVYVIPQNHKGIDITASIGTPVYAVADGKVIFSGFSSNDETPTSGYGNVVYLEHHEKIDGLKTETRYGHLSGLNVNYNDEIKKGDLIGLSGNTGGSRIPHLHFEVLINNLSIDPLEFLPDIGFINLTDRPSEKSNFAESSLILWNDIYANNWNYDVYAKCKYDIVLGENIINRGTELLIDKRIGQTIFINFNNIIYQCSADNLIFTY